MHKLILTVILLAIQISLAKSQTLGFDQHVAEATRYFENENWSSALNHYTAALEINMDYANGYFNKALCLVELNNFQEAIHDVNQYLKISPDDKDGLELRANTYMSLGDFRSAARDYTMILLEEIEAPILYNRGLAYLELSMYQKAKTDLMLARDLMESAEIENAIACLLLEMGEAQKAINYLLEAITEYPDNISMINNLIVAYCKINEFENALHWANEAVNIKTVSHFYCLRSLINNQLEHYEAGYFDAKKAIDLDQKNHLAYWSAGIALQKLNFADEAKRMWELSDAKPASTSTGKYLYTSNQLFIEDKLFGYQN